MPDWIADSAENIQYTGTILRKPAHPRACRPYLQFTDFGDSGRLAAPGAILRFALVRRDNELNAKPGPLNSFKYPGDPWRCESTRNNLLSF